MSAIAPLTFLFPVQVHHDRSASVGGASSCRGPPEWRSFSDAYLTSKCAFGTDPCGTDASSGFVAAAPGGSSACDAQCYYDGSQDEQSETLRPNSETLAGASMLDSLASQLQMVCTCMCMRCHACAQRNLPSQTQKGQCMCMYEHAEALLSRDGACTHLPAHLCTCTFR